MVHILFVVNSYCQCVLVFSSSHCVCLFLICVPIVNVIKIIIIVFILHKLSAKENHRIIYN